MPKKYKKGAAIRQRRGAKRLTDDALLERARKKRKRPNAKVPGKRRGPRKHEAAPELARSPRVTAQGKPFTRRQRSAAEQGHEPADAPQGDVPVVAIVGRPNVGKSSLFNRLAGSRIAIEDDRPGTTRDRVSALVQMKSADNVERVVQLFDTAGIGIVDEIEVLPHVEEQIDNAMAAADVVLFVLDARDGVIALDRQVADRLRRGGCKVLLVANKLDDPSLDDMANALYELGLGDPVRVSARSARNIKALRHAICELLPPKNESETMEAPELLLAVVGRRNVGKSSFVNVLADDERVIASELAGTTRDSVDVRFTYDGKSFVAIDTAGVRKKQSLQHSVEFFSQSRAFRAVRRASVVVLMLDALESVSQMDRKLVEVALHTHKPIIIAVNKWDLTNDVDTDDYVKYLRRTLGQIDFAPVVFMSVKERENVFDVVELARDLHRQSGERVGTGELNRVINAAFERHHPQPRQNRLGRIFYSTQVSVFPPQIVVFVNEPELFPENWRTYLRHRLHDTTVFSDVPIKLKFKARERVDLENK